MRSNGFKRICSLWLVFAMVFSLAMPTAATEVQDDPKVTFEQVDNDRVTASLLEEEESAETEPISLYEDTDEVRVSIFLEGASTIEHGYSTYNIAEDEDAMDYRQMLLENQYSVTAAIEETTGEELDVQWNLTLAANAISANVEYSQIEEIAKVDGVREVVIETQYTPAVLADSEGEYDPQMAISTDMTGMTQVFSNGYTGAGSRIAIIDTGIDTDHQSFDGDAFEYSLERNAEEKNIPYEEYVASLNLLDQEDLTEYLNDLNAKSILFDTSAEGVHKSSKIPFAFNYIDKTHAYVDHNQDSQTDHGSHVAGIAAANRYVKEDDGTMVDSVTEYKVVGNAPDAQLLVMKVFGVGGGAFDSDIIAAIEDAIILGADSINLSLGNATPSFTKNSTYAQVMERIRKTESVLVVAVGNEGAWPDYSNTEAQLGGGSGLLYTEDVQMGRIANPSSLTESFSVASVQNHGAINNSFISVTDDSGEEFLTTYNEQIYNKMMRLSSLDKSEDGSGTEYKFVLIDGFGDPADGELEKIDVEGKIVFIQRGKQVAFSDKAAYAVSKGAVATIIYNNEPGDAGMDMSAYQSKEPAVMISRASGEKIRSLATKKQASDGSVYYEGVLKIVNGVRVQNATEDYYTMSSFSNWGTTGDLALKPEITAPGGNIYSVNGSVEETNQYKLNSGTSMASPQVAGVVATVKQYLRDSGVGEAYSESFSERQLIQSMLMSTAQPLKDENGNYYSLLQQGAGLVDGSAAVTADSFIIMDEAYLTDKESGKVKAEVGDDPERTGIYEFSFELYNAGTSDKIFKMYADVFAQNVIEEVSAPDSAYMAEYMSKSTTPLSSYAVFSENGQSRQDSTIDVPAGTSATVKVRIVLNDSAKKWLEDHYTKGTYIQAFVYAEPEANDEGLKTATHSIAMLGFYGSWTDPSMYDSPSYYEGKVVENYSTPNTTDASRMPYAEDYTHALNGVSNVPFYGGNNVKISTGSNNSFYAFGGNPLVKEEYKPERNALSNGAYFGYWQYWLIRNSDSYYWSVSNKTTGEVYKTGSGSDDVLGVFYHVSSGAWVVNGAVYAAQPYATTIDFTLPELEEGTEIEVSLTNLPEFYGEGKLGYGEDPGDGATLRMSAVIDEAGPVVSDIQYNSNGTLDVTAMDSNYIAAVVLYTEDGKKVVSYTGSKEKIEKGEAAVYTVDASGNGAYLLQVFDYANNAATYLVEVDESEMTFNGNMLAYDLDTSTWVNISRYSEDLESVTREKAAYTAATAVGDSIYAVAYGTDLYKLSVRAPEEAAYIATLSVKPVDMAYNPVDRKLYAVTEDSLMVRIDPANGNLATLGPTPVETNTLACDSKGVFYSNRYGTGSVYSYTLDALKKGNTTYDFSGDGVVNDIDAQALLEYVTSVRSVINNRAFADIDSDGDIDTYDVYLLYEKVPGSAKLIASIGLSSKYMQAMECDPNSDALYWASYSTQMFGETEVGFSVLYGIDTETGEVTRYSDVWDQLSSLVLLDKDAGSIYEPIGGTTGLEGAEDKFYENKVEQSGVASLMGVNNLLKDEYLAAAEEEKTITVELKASENATNGLYNVQYDPASMTFVSMESGAGLTAMKESDGVITVGYAGKTAVAANKAAATLTFRTTSCESNAVLTLKQLNNKHLNVVSEQKAGAHDWGNWTVTDDATCMTEGSQKRICCKCNDVETQNIPVNELAHVWDEGTILKEAGENEPGIKVYFCDECDVEKRDWVMPLGAKLTEAEVTDINSVYIAEKYVMGAQLHNAGIEKAYRISTVDGSMRYLVYLSADTQFDQEAQVRISSYYNNNGLAFAIKGENTYDEISPINGGSKLVYDFDIQNGIGVMKCWSYNGAECTEFAFYFVVGDQVCDAGSVIYDTTSDGKTIGIRGAGHSVFSIWEEPKTVDGMIVVEGTIALIASTPLDAELVLEFPGSGRHSAYYLQDSVYLINDGEIDKSVDLAFKGLKLQLTRGQADVTVYGYNKYYNIHIVRRNDNAPMVDGNYLGSGYAVCGEPFRYDLSGLFYDLDEDELTYFVSVDGGAETEVAADYTCTFQEVGTKLLTIRAYDGTFYSEAYSLLVTVRAGDILLGDVNGDGQVDAKDVTTLKRYRAKWDGVTIVEEAADVNGDLTVDNKDVTWLARYLAGWEGYALD